jgi:hypothetical protein
MDQYKMSKILEAVEKEKKEERLRELEFDEKLQELSSIMNAIDALINDLEDVMDSTSDINLLKAANYLRMANVEILQEKIQIEETS